MSAFRPSGESVPRDAADLFAEWRGEAVYDGPPPVDTGLFLILAPDESLASRGIHAGDLVVADSGRLGRSNPAPGTLVFASVFPPDWPFGRWRFTPRTVGVFRTSGEEAARFERWLEYDGPEPWGRQRSCKVLALLGVVVGILQDPEDPSSLRSLPAVAVPPSR